MSKYKRGVYRGLGILYFGLIWIGVQIGIEMPNIFGSIMIGLFFAGIGIMATALAISNK